MTRTFSVLAMMMGAALLLGGCSAAPESAEDKSALEAKAKAAVTDLKKQDPSLEKTFFKTAKGYAVLPSIAKGGAGVGGAYGKGVVYKDGSVVGYCDVSQGSIGFQLGGQAYGEIVFFETAEALTAFQSGDFEFSAQVSAVAATAGAGLNADYSNGVAVFTFAQEGLMYEASVGGQKFDYVAK